MVLDPLFSAPFFSRYEQPRNISILGAYSYTTDMKASGWCLSLLLIHANFLKPTNRYLMVVPTLFVSSFVLLFKTVCNIAWQLPFYLSQLLRNDISPKMLNDLILFCINKLVELVVSQFIYLGNHQVLMGLFQWSPNKGRWLELNEIRSAFSCSFNIFCYLSAGLQEH